MQKTLIFLKPDALKSTETTCQVIERILAAGFRFSQGRLMDVTSERILKHYDHLVKDHGEPMKKKILDYFTGTKVFVMVAERENAVQAMRDLVGATDPSKAAKGTIRGDLSRDDLQTALKEGRFVNNLIHASDSPESVERETAIWLA